MKKAVVGASRDKEWVSSLMGETELNEMVEAGVCNTPVLCLHLGIANHTYRASSSILFIHA